MKTVSGVLWFSGAAIWAYWGIGSGDVQTTILCLALAVAWLLAGVAIVSTCED